MSRVVTGLQGNPVTAHEISNINGNISGGVFNNDPSAYVADGYAAYPSGNKFVVASVSDAVAEIGNVKYASLKDAVDAVAANTPTTINLIADEDLTEGNVTIPASKDVTLDLNGNSIKGDNNADILVQGTFTLKDSAENSTGKIYSSANYVGKTHGKGLICVNGNGTFNMESGTIYAVRDNAANNGQFGVQYEGYATVNISGGSITAGWYAVTGQGNNTGKPIVNITGGSMVSTTDYAVYEPDDAVINISGNNTVVSGAAGAVCANKGILNISGGNFASSGNGNTGSWSDGTGGLGNFTIILNAKYADVKATITGGTFTAQNNALTLSTGSGHTAQFLVSGGLFSQAVNADYCAPGFKPASEKVGDYYTVTLNSEIEGTTTSEGEKPINVVLDYSDDDSEVTAILEPIAEADLDNPDNARKETTIKQTDLVAFADATQVDKVEIITGLDATQEVGGKHAPQTKIVDEDNNVIFEAVAKGGQLRVDNKVNGENIDTDKADVRLQYEFELPDGATGLQWSWELKFRQNNGNTFTKHVVGANYRKNGDRYISNVVVNNVPVATYNTVSMKVNMTISYELNGVTYEITQSDTVPLARSIKELVNGLAESIDTTDLTDDMQAYILALKEKIAG